MTTTEKTMRTALVVAALALAAVTAIVLAGVIVIAVTKATDAVDEMMIGGAILAVGALVGMTRSSS